MGTFLFCFRSSLTGQSNITGSKYNNVARFKCFFLFVLYVLFLLLTVSMYSIVDCTHVGSATVSLEDMVTLHRRTVQQIFLFSYDRL